MRRATHQPTQPARTELTRAPPVCSCLSCEKKVEIDFHVRDAQHDLRTIPRASIDAFLTLAKCTVISTRNNKHFDSYLLSESSLFIFPTKIILKTCGTTMLLKSVEPILVRRRGTKGASSRKPAGKRTHDANWWSTCAHSFSLSFAFVLVLLGGRQGRGRRA